MHFLKLGNRSSSNDFLMLEGKHFQNPCVVHGPRCFSIRRSKLCVEMGLIFPHWIPENTRTNAFPSVSGDPRPLKQINPDSNGKQKAGMEYLGVQQ